jgi:hypothetical protein
MFFYLARNSDLGEGMTVLQQPVSACLQRAQTGKKSDAASYDNVLGMLTALCQSV